MVSFGNLSKDFTPCFQRAVRPTDVASTLLFIFDLFNSNQFRDRYIRRLKPVEERRKSLVRPYMKRIPLFSLVTAVAVVGFASSAQAGLSIGFFFGLPAPVFHAPRAVVVVQPPCPPVVVYHPVRHCEPIVYQPTLRCAPVVYVAPGYERHYDYRDQRGYDHRRSEHSYRSDDRGHDRGGHR
jgi:hypothetical protein